MNDIAWLATTFTAIYAARLNEITYLQQLLPLVIYVSDVDYT